MPTTPMPFATRQTLAWQAVPTLVGLTLLAGLAAGGVGGPYAKAGPPCHVPGDFATLQAAVDDDTCTAINVAAGDYAGRLDVDRTVTIRGAGADETRLVGAGGPVVAILDGTVSIEGVTITGGSGGLGGGLIIQGTGTLTLKNSTLTENTADLGGGLYNAGTLTLKNSTVTANMATSEGGGLFNFNGGTLTVENSTVTANTASSGGRFLEPRAAASTMRAR